MQLIAFGIAVPAVLHGLYDWSAGAFASLWVPIIIQALSLFLFLGYTMSAAAIERQVRRTPMFRGESMLMERITDGQPPPQADPRPTRGGAQPPEDWARPRAGRSRRRTGRDPRAGRSRRRTGRDPSKTGSYRRQLAERVNRPRSRRSSRLGSGSRSGRRPKNMPNITPRSSIAIRPPM